MKPVYVIALLVFSAQGFAQGVAITPPPPTLCTPDGAARAQFIDLSEISRHGATDILASAQAKEMIAPATIAEPKLEIHGKKSATGALGDFKAFEDDALMESLANPKLDKDALDQYIKTHPHITGGKLGKLSKGQHDLAIGVEQFVLGAGKPSPFMAIIPEKPTNPAILYRSLTIGDRTKNVAYDLAGSAACAPAVNRVRMSDATRPNRTYLSASAACALLNYDAKCLTRDANAEFIDLEAAQRAVAALTHKQEAWCMGLLVQTGPTLSLLTARHCFARPVDGKEWTLPKLRQGETLDGQRSFTISDTEAAKLIPGAPFGVNRDAILIPVSVNATPGAKPLPGAVWMNNAPDATVVWIPGVVTDLLEALQLRNRIEKNINTQLPWRDSLRWGKWLNGDASIKLSKQGCHYYSAQTWRGFSGAPIVVQATASKIIVAGVHSGAVGASGKSDWKACGTTSEEKIAAQQYNLGDAEISP